jgi:hypothetical protein
MHGVLLPRSDMLAVWAVWGLSIAVILVGFVFAARDVAVLWREGRALDRARSKGEGFVDHVGASAAVEHTVVAQRARRIYDLRHESGAAIQGVRLGLKAEAAAQLAGIATVPRFLSSTLLLLAVVGTFVGMKTALPLLTEALTFDSVGPAVDRNSIGIALTEIANAFGANFLALIGALCLGIVAFGAGAERRALVTSLESFSERHLFPRLPSGADNTAIERLVHELRTSIGEIVAVGSGIGDLRGAIEGFQHSLSQSIGSMQAAFSGQFQRDLLRVQRESATNTQELTKSVTEIAKALGTTTLAYEGLVEGLRERDYGLGRAAAANIAAAETLTQANDRIADQIRIASTELASTGKQLGGVSKNLLERVRTLEETHERSTAELNAGALAIEASIAGLHGEATALRDELRLIAGHHATLLDAVRVADANAVDGLRRVTVSVDQGTGEVAQAAREAVVATREAAAQTTRTIEPALARLQQSAQDAAAESGMATKALAAIAQQVRSAREGSSHERAETLTLVRQALAAQEAQAAELAGMRRELVQLARTLEQRAADSRARLTVDAVPFTPSHAIANGHSAEPSGT